MVFASASYVFCGDCKDSHDFRFTYKAHESSFVIEAASSTVNPAQCLRAAAS